MAGLKFSTGLDFGGMGNVTSGRGNPAPASIAQAAYGPGYTGDAPALGSSLAPNDAFGVSFWTGIGAIVLLIVIRQSLPR